MSFDVVGFAPGSVVVRYRVNVGGSSTVTYDDVSQAFGAVLDDDLSIGGLVLEQIGGYAK